MTGLHGLHVLVGIFILSVMLILTIKGRSMKNISSLGKLWIVLAPCRYHLDLPFPFVLLDHVTPLGNGRRILRRRIGSSKKNWWGEI